MIADQLAQSGASIAFAVRDKSILGKRTFDAHILEDIQTYDFNSNIFALYDYKTIDKIVWQESVLLQAIKPDVVVGDMRATLAISCRMAGIPYISVLNGYMTDYFNPVNAMLDRKKTPLKHFAATFFSKIIQRKQKKNLAENLRRYAQHFGLKNLNSLYDFFKGDLNLIADLPSFCPLNNLPQNYQYIGPLIWEGEEKSRFAIPKKNGLLIYATTGNTGAAKFIEWIYNAFANRPEYQVILTLGAYNYSSLMPASNITVAPFIPGSEVLQHADIAIHCAGNGTTYQMMRHGVPAIAIPFNNDQSINAWLIHKYKIGIAVSPSKVSAELLRFKVKALITTDTYRKNIEPFRVELSKHNGAQNAAEAILKFLNCIQYENSI